MRIVITTPDGQTKVQTVTSLRELKAAIPGLGQASFPGAPSDAWLIANNIPARLSQETAQPTTEYGQTAVADDELQPDGTWLQTWAVQSITLAEAKQALALAIADLYVGKVTAATPAQLLAGGYVGAIQTRDTAFKPTLDDVAARVQAASTVAEAKAIADELGLL